MPPVKALKIMRTVLVLPFSGAQIAMAASESTRTHVTAAGPVAFRFIMTFWNGFMIGRTLPQPWRVQKAGGRVFETNPPGASALKEVVVDYFKRNARHISDLKSLVELLSKKNR